MVRRRIDSLVFASCLCASFTLFLVVFRSPPMQYDSRNSIPLGNGLYEAIRLNELVAQVQYSCQKSHCFPSGSRCWPICYDFFSREDHKLSGFSLLSIPNIESLSFESALLTEYPKSKVLFIVPVISDEDAIVKLKNSYPQIKYRIANLIPRKLTSEQTETEKEPRGILLGELLKDHDESLPSVMKWDCLNVERRPGYSLCTDLVKDFVTLHNLSRVQQLLLTVRIASQDSLILFEWYKALNDLFFTANFALFNSAQRGECGRRTVNCEYRLSFVRIPRDGSATVLAPVMGMGSPEEEFSRFINYATTPQVNCKVIGKVELNYWTDGYSGTSWKLCMDAPFGLFNHTCLLYYFSFREIEVSDKSFIEPLSNEGCEIHIFDTKIRKSFDVEEQRLHYHTFALASNNNSVSYHERSGIKLLSLREIIKRLGHFGQTVDVMMWDIQGYEWDVLGPILSSGVLKQFNQIVIRCRLWYGEENHNYRAFFTYFYRLRMQHFALFDVSYINANCRGCIELSWIRVTDYK